MDRQLYHPRGRTTVAEILIVTDAVRSKIQRGVSDRELEQIARRGGMDTLLQDGLRKAALGETTLAEVLKVARL